MKTLEEIKAAIEAAVPGASVSVIPNGSPSGQQSLLLDAEHAFAVASFLRDDEELALDYLSNVTGVDWLDKETSEKVKVTRQVPKEMDGPEGKQIQMVEETVEETRKHLQPGYLEAVYHLFSVKKKHGPVVIRMRTKNRTNDVELPSLTPLWRAAEFRGHPDLRRILMWDGFKDHPMRKDYVEPDDFEYEPTAHDKVLGRHKQHQDREQGTENREQKPVAG